MISFSNINKQYGKQLLFVDASFQLNPGEKVGLVGPNGAGKTTLLRMVVGEETPDEGAVSVPKKLTIGYFRQDVEEMQGRSVLDEAIAGSGRVGDLHHELEALQREMSDPDKADDMDRILDRFGHVQEEYEHLGGYALESQAREVLHGLGFKDDQIDGDVGALSYSKALVQRSTPRLSRCFVLFGNIINHAPMKLSPYVLEELAKMVVGDGDYFPYRSSHYITSFFARCGLPFVHDGTTRPRWAADRLEELNLGAAQSPDLPSDDLCRVIHELFDQDDFDRYNNKIEISPAHLADVELALASFNKLVKRQGLIAYLDESGRCYLRSTGTGMTSASLSQAARPLSQEEITQRQKLAEFLDSASEDEFTERVLVPLFQRLGFHRVSPSGHKEKTLEYGKDLWMKFHLPTGHWIYFCAQVKRDKLDASGSGGNNVATVLNQARMAIESPIFDADTNRKVLLDHLYLISAGEITRAARAWLVEQLDVGQRRHIIFMDRDEFLDQSARILLDLRLDSPILLTDEDIPF